MSTFGDHTPLEELLQAAMQLQKQFNLTDEQLVSMLLKVTMHISDPFDIVMDSLQSDSIKDPNHD